MNRVTQKVAHLGSKIAKSTGQAGSPQSTSVTVNFEALKPPIKSASDKKDYKVIRLENGLTACLISDIVNCPDVASILSVDSETESESESDESESDEGSVQSTVSTDGDEGKIRKVAPNTKMAAAALCIGVGSFSDPKEIQGLAHFLEHMVFMGSEKFPQENDFDSFIKKHGGSDNASTDCETTTFYLECFEKHLYKALDKFAQFFISPLMKRESMTREREAVESEFQIALPSDEYRRDQILASLARLQSPVNSFSWGNSITLQDNISDDRLYERLHEFRKRHYSAHRMTLAIQARLPMDMLETYVVECFSNVPNNKLPAEEFKEYAKDVFDTPQFKRIYYIKPMKDICNVHLTWALPSLLHMYKSKPHVYVSWLIGHEGKDSLLSYLKKKVWVLSIYAGNGESGSEHNSLYALFEVSLVLTVEGYENLPKVIEAVFSYIKLLKKLGPQERIFKEIQTIEETSFRFAEEETASDNVEDVAECMQFYPPEDYLRGSDLFFEYNPKAINMVVDNLIPDKMNVMVFGYEDKTFDKLEPWFKVPYTDTDIPAEWLKLWSHAKPLPDFSLPEPNPFLTNDFSLLPKESNNPEYPIKIMSSSLIELWYRKDQKFLLPTAFYYYYLITPLALESATSACMLEMFVTIASLSQGEEAYPAQIADLSYSISSTEKGILIKVEGYNEKLPILITTMTKYLTNVGETLTPEIFEAIRLKHSKLYYNNFRKPSKLSRDVRLSILQDKYVSLIEKYAAISKITFDMMKQFSTEVTKQLYIQALVQGNVTAETAIKTTEQLIAELQCQSLPSKNMPKILVNEIPKGEHCCKIMSFNENDGNSIITNYYQCGPITIKDDVIMEYMLLLIDEPLFDILRTKEQLGYNVNALLRDTYGILGFTVTVNAQASKNTVEHVDMRIEAFIKKTRKILKKLSDKKINQFKRDLIKLKQCVDMDLEEECIRNWDEIIQQKYMFDRMQREIQAIEDLKISEVRKWWDAHTSCSDNKNVRKLSMQIVGHDTKGSAIKKDDTVHDKTVNQNKKDEVEEKTFKLEFVKPINENPNVYFISNVKEFKRSLKLYPEISK